MWIGNKIYCDLCSAKNREPAEVLVRVGSTVVAEVCDRHAELTLKSFERKRKSNPGPPKETPSDGQS